MIEIDDAGFTPFHVNATCAIRPQSLIGEKYVDCEPAAGVRAWALAARIHRDRRIALVDGLTDTRIGELFIQIQILRVTQL